MDTSITTSHLDEQSNCSVHKNNDVHLFCLNCDRFLCLECTTDEHKNHQYDTIQEIINQKHKQVLQCVQDTKEKESTLIAVTELLIQAKGDYSDGIKSLKTELYQKCTEWKQLVDSIIDGFILQLHETEAMQIRNLQTKQEKLKQNLSKLKEFIQECEEILELDHLPSISKLATECFKKANQFKSDPDLTTPKLPYFMAGNINKDVIQNMIGQLEAGTCTQDDLYETEGEKSSDMDYEEIGTSPTIDTTVISYIYTGISKTDIVSVIDNKRAWCGSRSHDEVVMTNIDGQVLKKVKLESKPYDMVVMSEGEILFTEDGGQAIKKYTGDKNNTTISDLSPFCTYGLCVTSDDDILICLYKGSVFKGQGKVVRLSAIGKIKQEIMRDQNNKLLFSKPQLIAENINNDICVVDNSANSSTLVVVNQYGLLQFRYPDSTLSFKTNPDCQGIVCDKLGYILFSDWKNDCIHQISKDGHFTTLIFTQQDGINWCHHWQRGLSIDDKGQLWACENYKVNVFKYRSNSFLQYQKQN